MKNPDSWIEILLETGETWPEALHGLSSALVDQGACGAILDEHTEDTPSNGTVCRACGEKSLIKVYFPAGVHTVEEVLSLVERTARQTKGIYNGLDIRILRIHTIDYGGWAENWKAYFVPRRISQRIFVAPPWDIPDIPSDAILLVIDPGRAFGTGQHPTTALCLEFLDALAQDRGGLTGPFLDVGYGSGILCMAAHRLGATDILGVDSDQDVVEEALKNFSYNKINNQIQLVAGTLECVRKSFDTVTANLDVRLLTQSVQLVKERVNLFGRLIISGILEEQASEIRTLYEGAGFCIEHEKTVEGWKALNMSRKA